MLGLHALLLLGSSTSQVPSSQEMYAADQALRQREQSRSEYAGSNAATGLSGAPPGGASGLHMGYDEFARSYYGHKYHPMWDLHHEDYNPFLLPRPHLKPGYEPKAVFRMLDRDLNGFLDNEEFKRLREQNLVDDHMSLPGGGNGVTRELFHERFVEQIKDSHGHDVRVDNLLFDGKELEKGPDAAFDILDANGDGWVHKHEWLPHLFEKAQPIVDQNVQYHEEL